MKTLVTLQITIFFLTFTGFLFRRLGIISKEGQKNVTDLVIYLVLPCNIFKSFLANEAGSQIFSFLSILLISFGIEIFSVIFSKIVYRHESTGRRKCLQYATICSNAGFLGTPFAEGLFGSQGLLLATIYLIPVRIFMWSEGLAIFTGNKNIKKTIIKVVTHPCIIACFSGILFMLMGWKLPAGLMGAVTLFGQCNTALSMMVIGMILAQIDLRELLDGKVLRFSLFRLIIIPAVVLIVCRFLPINNTVLSLCVLLAAMPAGATTSILAEKYQVESPFATKLVVLSTLLSLPSIALWNLVLHYGFHLL